MLNITPAFLRKPQPFQPPPPPPPPLPPVEFNNNQLHPRAQSIANEANYSLTAEEASSAKTAFALFEKNGRISFNDIPEVNQITFFFLRI